jgi:uncharacterized cupin superfamily protein
MNRSSDGGYACPYCGRPLHWVSLRWFGRGCFECERCGEFPDLGDAASRSVRAATLAGHTPPRIPQKQAGRPRVLLVDDSVEHRDLYALMLEETATVVTASRGEDALAIARAEPLDAVVVDVLMPGMDGWTVAERLKASPLTSSIPVIMLTSLDGLEVPERAQRVGAAAGATRLGATVYEIDPGGAVSPYHVHHGNEEMLVVLAGTPSLRTPEGTRRLEAGALVAFRRGGDGAHQVFNASDAPARVLLISTMHFPDVAEHVDTGATLAITSPGAGKTFPAGSDRPTLEMVVEAMRAAES